MTGDRPPDPNRSLDDLMQQAARARFALRVPEAIELYHEVRDRAAAAGDVVRAARAALAVGTCREQEGDLAALGECGRFVLDLLGDRHDPALLAGAHAMLAVDAGHRDDQPELFARLALARALIETVDAPSTELIRAVNQAADAYLSIDCFADAHALYRKLLRDCGDHDGGAAAAWTHVCLASTTFEWAEFVLPVDPDLAHRLWQECADSAAVAEAAARATDNAFVRTVAVPLRALATASLGLPEDALAVLDCCDDELTGVDLAIAGLARVRAHRERGETDEARRGLEQLDRDLPAGEWYGEDIERGVMAVVRRERLLLARQERDTTGVIGTLEEIVSVEARRRVDGAARQSAAIAAQVRASALQLQLHEQGRRIRTLTDLSNTDALTGLLNRRGLVEEVGRLVTEVARVGVAVIDLDRFKQINDTFSHATGDAVLVRVADRLRAACRGGDVVGRVGGDEFVVVTADPAAAPVVGTRVLAAVRAADWSDLTGTLGVSVSVGIGTSPGSTDLATLIEEADRALRSAKADGRDRVTVG